jgi:glycosyltransferase involved in cell wall biosynthesis
MDRLAEMLSAADLAVVCLERLFTGLSVPSKAYGVMASGTPILGFVDPSSEIGRMISESRCGLVLPDPGPAEIAASLRDLMTDGAKRKAMAEAGRSAFLASYTLARAARAYDTILSSMVNGKSRATN